MNESNFGLIKHIPNIPGNKYFNDYFKKYKIFVNIIANFIKSQTVSHNLNINITEKSIFQVSKNEKSPPVIEFFFSEDNKEKVTIFSGRFTRYYIEYHTTILFIKIRNDDEFFHKIIDAVEKELLST